MYKLFDKSKASFFKFKHSLLMGCLLIGQQSYAVDREDLLQPSLSSPLQQQSPTHCNDDLCKNPVTSVHADKQKRQAEVTF